MAPLNPNVMSFRPRAAIFPKFAMLPDPIQTNVLRQSLNNRPPQLHYDGPKLARVPGPLPFCGPASRSIMNIVRAAMTEDDHFLLQEPQTVEHVFHITSETEDLDTWQFPSTTPVTHFKNITFHASLYDMEKMQRVRRFMLRFTSAINIEVFFAGTYNQWETGDLEHLGRAGFHRVVLYDTKDVLKVLPKL